MQSIKKDSQEYVHIGCFEDKPLDRTMGGIEGHCDMLDGYYANRVKAIEKCYQCALERNFTIFALQNGGMCRADNKGLYAKHGVSSACSGSGKGGPWANDVYKIIPGTPEPGNTFN